MIIDSRPHVTPRPAIALRNQVRQMRPATWVRLSCAVGHVAHALLDLRTREENRNVGHLWATKS